MILASARGHPHGSHSGSDASPPRCAQGEAYADPHTAERKWKLEQRKKNLTNDGFRYSNPNAKSSGLGGYWGCMEPSGSSRRQHQAEFNVLTKDMKPAPVAHEKAQVLTNPPKEGHHLTPGITFGAPGGHKKGSEFEHLADPISAQREAETAERKHHEKMRGGRAPFRSMSRSVDFFDAQVAEPPARARLPRTPPCHCRALAMPI